MKWKRPSRMVGEPGQDVGVLVGGVVVEDGVDHLAGRHGSLDGRDEADELLMPVARHAAADDLAFEHAEGGEQGRGAVALVVVGHGRAPARLQRQAGLGAVERLDLALLVDGHHHGVAGRVHVQTHARGPRCRRARRTCAGRAPPPAVHCRSAAAEPQQAPPSRRPVSPLRRRDQARRARCSRHRHRPAGSRRTRSGDAPGARPCGPGRRDTPRPEEPDCRRDDRPGRMSRSARWPSGPWPGSAPWCPSGQARGQAQPCRRSAASTCASMERWSGSSAVAQAPT